MTYNGRMGRRKKVIGATVGLTVVLGMVFGISSWREEQRYQETLRELRALGATTNRNDVDKQGKSLGESDGSFEAALAAYKAIPGASDYAVNMRGWVPAAGPGDAKRARQVLEDLLPLVQTAASGSRLDTGNWRLQSEFSEERPAAAKAFAGMMVGETKLASLRGDAEAALTALGASNDIAVLLSQNPGHFDMLVAMGCQGLYWTAANAYLDRFSGDLKALEGLEYHLANRKRLQPVDYGFKGELGFVLDGLERPQAITNAIKNAETYSGVPTKAQDKILNAFMGAASVKTATKRKLAKHFTDALVILENEPKLLDQLVKVKNLDSAMDSDRSLSGKAVNLVWGGFTPTLEVQMTVIARGRVLRMAAHCLAERAKTGKLPSKLPSLGEDSIDPFTGHPLTFISTQNSFKVYSIGKNLINDGGHRRGLTGEDIVYEFVASSMPRLAATAP